MGGALNHKERFQLEPLEQRVMLSADGLLAAALETGQEDSGVVSVAEEYSTFEDSASIFSDSDPDSDSDSDSSVNLFAGLDQDPLVTPAIVEEATAEAEDTEVVAVTESAVVDEQSTTASAPFSASSVEQTDSPTGVVDSASNDLLSQLVETLHVANAPPYDGTALDGSADWLDTGFSLDGDFLLPLLDTAPERPLIFLPGFGGTFAADQTDAGVDEWLLTRGMHPDDLTLEPLTHAYDNIVQSFQNVGYTLDADFFVGLWDWRVPVALDVSAYDGDTPSEVFDGTLDSVTASDLRDSYLDGLFDTGLSYLTYWIDQAVTVWTGSHGMAPDSVDIVTHSTGGLVARSYIQSSAYGTDGLLQVHNLVQVGVPNQGVSNTWNLLQNDFSQKLASRVLGLIVGQAYDLVQNGATLINPVDGSEDDVTWADVVAQSDPEKWFIYNYVSTLQDLLPTYDNVFFEGETPLGLFNEANQTTAGIADPIENKLLLDLNAGSDPNAWVDQVLGTVTIVYSDQVDTEDQIIQRVGPNLLLGLDNELLPFGHYIGNWPGDSTVWYQDAESDSGTEGDGTVPTVSSVGLFLGDSRLSDPSPKLVLVEITSTDAGEAVEHTGLTNNVYSQTTVIQSVTGTQPLDTEISDDLELGQFDAAQTLLDLGIVSLPDVGKELLTRLPVLAVNAASTAVADLNLLFDLALQSLGQLLAGYLVNQEIVLPDNAGTIQLNFNGDDAIELTANLDIAVDDFIHVRGNLTLRKVLGSQPVDVATGFPANLGDLGSEILGALDLLPQDTGDELYITGDFSAIKNLPMSFVTLGGSDLTVFVGLNGPYWFSDDDGDGQFDQDEANPDATGLAITDVDFGLVLMSSPLGLLPGFRNILPSFYALKATAAQAGVVGLDGVMQASASDITVRVNNSGGWPGGFGPPVVDFAASFPGGYEVSTGGEPIYIDFDGNQRIGASAERVTLQLSQFVHVTGSFAFEKGPTARVTMATGLPANALDLLEAAVNAIAEGVGTELRGFATAIPNLEVSTMQIGASGLHGFVGLNGPYWEDVDGDGQLDMVNEDLNEDGIFNDGTSGPLLDEEADDRDYNGDGDKLDLVSEDLNGDGTFDVDERNADAYGLVVNDLDLGFVTMTPTVEAFVGLFSESVQAKIKRSGIIPKFTALKATSQSVEMVGFDELQMVASGITINYNNGTEWPGGFGPPVVDFAASFAEEDDGGDGVFDAEDDLDGDGKQDPAGFEVGTGGEPVYIDFDGNQRIGASAARVTLQLSQFVHVTGSFAFEKGPTERVTVSTGLPSDLAGFSSQILQALDVLPKEGTVGFGELQIANDFSKIYNLEVGTLQIGVSNAHAFVGLGGPYWTDDADGDGQLDTVNEDLNGDGIFNDGNAGRDLLDEAADDRDYNGDGDKLDLVSEDLNGDGTFDVDERSGAAIGLVVQDLDFGFVMMTPTLSAIPGLAGVLPKFYALKGSADLLSFVGVDAISMDLEGVAVGVNLGKAWPGGVFGTPIVDFAASFNTNELLDLFDPTGDGIVTVEELRDLSGFDEYAGLYDSTAGSGEIIGIEQILQVLDAAGNGNGRLELSEAAAFVGDEVASAADADGDGKLDPAGFEVGTGEDPVYIDFNGKKRIGALVEKATLQLSSFVYVTGSVAFEKGPSATVDLRGGLLGETVDDANELLDQMGLPPDTPIPYLDSHKALSFMTIGAANVHAFVGLNGPYWKDANGNGLIDRDPDTDQILPEETNPDAVGLVLDDFDFGLALMKPTSPLDPAKYYALRASAGLISLVGIDGVTVKAEHVVVELNQSSPSVYGLSLFPVVDFEGSFANEQSALFDLDQNGAVTVGELRSLSGEGAGSTFEGLYAADTTDGTVLPLEQIIQVLDTDENGVLEVSEASVLAGVAAAEADADGDGKIDPAGFEIATGGDPVYLDMNSSLLLAKGFLEMDVLGVITLSGSIAFELGATQEVVLEDGSTTEVTTMTLGAANIAAFAGYNGPYWTDLDGDHQVDDPAELSTDAIGLAITDLDVGLAVMASTDPTDLGVYVALQASVFSFGLVNVPGVTATGTLDVGINVGIGLSGIQPVDFKASFVGEQMALFDFDQNGSVTVGDLRALTGLGPDSAFTGLYETDTADDTVLTLEQIAQVLDTSGNHWLEVGEAAVLAGTAAAEADTNGDGRIDPAGWAINTGDPSSPVLLDFDGFVIDIQLAGALKIVDVFRVVGASRFQADSEGVKVFAAGSMEIGPDIEESDPLVDIQALGVLILNKDGAAGDLDIDFSLGTDDIGFSVSARVLFNTTGEDQSIVIPDRLLAVIEESGDDLAGLLLTRLETVGNDKLYTVKAGAPKIYSGQGMPDLDAVAVLLGQASGTVEYEEPGPYVVAILSGELNFLGFATGHGLAALSVRADAFELIAKLQFTIGPLKFDAQGDIGIYSDGVALNIGVSLDVNVLSIFHVSAAGHLQVDTTGSNNYFRLDVNGSLNLLGVIKLGGGMIVEVDDGAWKVEIPVDHKLSASFFGLATIQGWGWFQSDGQFDIHVRGNINLGAGGTGLFGSVSFDASYVNEELSLTASISGKAKLFGITLAGFTGTFNYTSTTGKLTLRVTVKILWWRVGKTFTLGTFKLAPQVPVPPFNPAGNLEDGTVWTDGKHQGGSGVLYLNLGDRAGYRSTAGDGDFLRDGGDETFTIRQISGSPSDANGATVEVIALGRSATYQGVTKIVLLDSGPGEDVVILGSDGEGGSAVNYMNVPFYGNTGDDNDSVEYHGNSNVPLGIVNLGGGVFTENLTCTVCVLGGNGEDEVRIGGTMTGTSMVYGEAGSDYLENVAPGGATLDGGDDNDVLLGGDATETLNGGNGDDLIWGKGGSDEIDGGTGDDHIYWGAGEGQQMIRGGADSDTLVLVGTDANDTLTISSLGSGQARLVYGGAGNATIDVQGTETIDVRLGQGDNTVTVNDMLDSGVNVINLEVARQAPPVSDVLFENELPTGLAPGLDVITFNGSSRGDRYLVATPENTLQVVQSDEENTVCTVTVTNLSRSEGDTAAVFGLSGNDRFVASDVAADVAGLYLHGGDGEDEVLGPDIDNTWTLTETNAGNLNNLFTFDSIESIQGGAAVDTLLGPPIINTWALTGNNSGILNGALTFSSIEVLIGGVVTDTVVGPASNNTWTLSANNAGDLNGALTFSSIEVLIGGIDTDTVVGPASDNTWTLSGNNAGNLNGALTFASIEEIVGGSGIDTLVGPSGDNIWTLSGQNAGDLNGALDFSAVENLVGGIDDDTFAFSDGASISGIIDGGGGINRLDYSAYTSAVMVDLQAGTATGTGGIVNINGVKGGSGNDVLGGDTGDNVLEGLGGNDILIGRGGLDTLLGGEGMDVLVGDQGQLVFDNNPALASWAALAVPVRYRVEYSLNLVSWQPLATVAVTGDTGSYVDSNAHGLMCFYRVVEEGQSGRRVPLTLWRQADGSVQLSWANITDVSATLAAPAGEGAGDVLDGGPGSDLIFGDSVRLEVAGDSSNPRFRLLGGALIYDAQGHVLVSGPGQLNPDGTPAWSEFRITLLEGNGSMSVLELDGGEDDYIAGGPGDDMIFGQEGNDVIQGDGSTDLALTGDARVGAYRDAANLLQLNPSFGASSDGDDYIEGGSGNDVIFGNLGQDDLIGGSSSLFGLGSAEQRADGSDLIFGGAGTAIAYNDLGGGHALDADVIVGDNGNIFRLLGATGAYLSFHYDSYGPLKIIPRAVQWLDYTPGGPDYNPAAADDRGAGDELHGEGGDDVIYGQVGNDVLFGEGQDDDLIGGWGNDWISGGTGDDGVLGDDGRIYTSRNGTAEPLYGIAATEQDGISTPGRMQQATINVTGQLKKTVNLEPFNLDPYGLMGGVQDPLYRPLLADDILYGGWGNDSVHGGAGDDAISGAEALPEFYAAPDNPGNVLGYGEEKAGEFGVYDEYDPLLRVEGFLLNFEAGTQSDGNDALFGDLGNDWLVGGCGNDNLYGGWGDDLLNADDDLGTAGGLNNVADTDTYTDRAYGGAGRDVLIANTMNDRLIDWVGQFNIYVVPFASNGAPTIHRALSAGLADFLYALSASDGADPTRAADTGADAARNGEPEGELGLPINKDVAWREQTGAPADALLGEIPAGPRDTLASATFNDGLAEGFVPDSGTWSVTDGRFEVGPTALGGDAVSVYYINGYLPQYFEIRATINAVKPLAGSKANAYMVFDYRGPNDFKFVGVNVSNDKIEMGYRDASGWHVEASANAQLKPDTDYNLLLSVNGTSVALVVDNQSLFTHVFAPRIDPDGFVHGLNEGFVGLGADNASARIDNVMVQVLRPEVAYEYSSGFESLPTDLLGDAESGTWGLEGGTYTGGAGALDLMNLEIGAGYRLDLVADVSTTGAGGFLFDCYSAEEFKFVAISAQTNQVVLGHHTTQAGWVVDAAVSRTILGASNYTLALTLQGNLAGVTLNGQKVLSYAYNALVSDGGFGLLGWQGSTAFDTVGLQTNDPMASLFSSSVASAGDSLLDELESSS